MKSLNFFKAVVRNTYLVASLSFFLGTAGAALASEQGTVRLSGGSPQKIEAEIIQIDTGSAVSFDGAIRMPASPGSPWSPHGTQMGLSLFQEASDQGLWQIEVRQLEWVKSDEINPRLWQAIDERPRVISMSLAGDRPNAEEELALLHASNQDILVVVASGNKGLLKPQYPGAYRGIPCLVSVSTFDPITKLRVESANPGEIYLAKAPQEDGTSFSTARSAAIALRIWRRNPSYTCSDVKSALVRTFPLPGGHQNSRVWQGNQKTDQ